MLNAFSATVPLYFNAFQFSWALLQTTKEHCGLLTWNRPLTNVFFLFFFPSYSDAKVVSLLEGGFRSWIFHYWQSLKSCYQWRPLHLNFHHFMLSVSFFLFVFINEIWLFLCFTKHVCCHYCYYHSKSLETRLF